MPAKPKTVEESVRDLGWELEHFTGGAFLPGNLHRAKQGRFVTPWMDSEGAVLDHLQMMLKRGAYEPKKNEN